MLYRKRAAKTLAIGINSSMKRGYWNSSGEYTGGVHISGGMLSGRISTPIATLVADTKLVRFDVPHAQLWDQYTLVRDACKRAGLKAFIAPRNVLRQAGVRTKTVEVVDQQRGNFFRREQTLIRADVSIGQEFSRDARKAYFLCGYDEQERRPSYFFCELPGEPTTVAEAVRSLKPKSVIEAEKRGMRVRRQGDVYLIRLSRQELDRIKVPDEPETGIFFENTNHILEEGFKDGDLTFGRGSLRHSPDGRKPDHKPIRIGRRWHLLVKNTVPVIADPFNPHKNWNSPRFPWG
jgi:hypothetical protein